MINDREGFLRRPDAPPGKPQPLKSLGARHLMHKMTVDIDQARAIGFGMDEMIIKDLVVKRARFGHEAGTVLKQLLQKNQFGWQFLAARRGDGKSPRDIDEAENAMRPPVAPYLTVSPALAAITFYKTVIVSEVKSIMLSFD